MTDTYVVSLAREVCFKCHIVFAMPVELQQRALKDSTVSFFCPNGHSQVYRESELDRTRRERDRLKQQVAARDDWLATAVSEKQAEKRAHAATKGKLTKVKKRADAGVCQHCQRTFSNVAAHVKHMHPEAQA